MHLLEIVFSWFYQYIDSITVLSLAAVGLVVIFGVMGVINMAHGEMMMVGAYVTSICYYKGVPVAVAIPVAGLVAAAFGVVLERFIIRRFYGQLLSSMVVTWGISIAMSQAALLAFGPQMRSVPTPFGSFSVGGLSYSYFRVFPIRDGVVNACLVMVDSDAYPLRAALARHDGKSANGERTRRLYPANIFTDLRIGNRPSRNCRRVAGSDLGDRTFSRASLYAAGFHHSGGWRKRRHSNWIGRKRAVAGAVKSIFTNQFNILFGHVALLLAAFLIIRLMPSGISNWIEQRPRVGTRQEA